MNGLDFTCSSPVLSCHAALLCAQLPYLHQRNDLKTDKTRQAQPKFNHNTIARLSYHTIPYTKRRQLQQLNYFSNASICLPEEKQSKLTGRQCQQAQLSSAHALIISSHLIVVCHVMSCHAPTHRMKSRPVLKPADVSEGLS